MIKLVLQQTESKANSHFILIAFPLLRNMLRFCFMLPWFHIYEDLQACPTWGGFSRLANWYNSAPEQSAEPELSFPQSRKELEKSKNFNIKQLVCSPPNQDVRRSFAPRRSAKIILQIVQPRRMLILPERQYAIVLYREQKDSLGRIIRNKVECFKDKNNNKCLDPSRVLSVGKHHEPKVHVWTSSIWAAEEIKHGINGRGEFSSALQMARCVNCASWVENVDLSATESAPPTQFNAAAESGSL